MSGIESFAGVESRASSEVHGTENRGRYDDSERHSDIEFPCSQSGEVNEHTMYDFDNEVFYEDSKRPSDIELPCSQGSDVNEHIMYDSEKGVCCNDSERPSDIELPCSQGGDVNEHTTYDDSERLATETVSDNPSSGDVKNDSCINPENINVKEYFDDNGVKYRAGNTLVPGVTFVINGYKYVTDSIGRIISAGGLLRICDSDYSRYMEKVRNMEGQEYKESDERGHIIGHRFGGSDRLENLVPMDARLNRVDFKKLENTLAAALEDGAKVYLKVEPVYEGTSTRPSEFRVTYSIDGDKEVIVFKNESEENI